MMHLTPDTQDGDDGLLTEMNTTPLIDVMLVLLVMLIITIPIQLHAVNLNLPQPSQAAAPPLKPTIITIDINADNQILWDNEVLDSKASLQTRLLAIVQAAPSTEAQPEVHVRPNERAQYAQVAAVLSAAQRAGVRKIGMVSPRNGR